MAIKILNQNKIQIIHALGIETIHVYEAGKDFVKYIYENKNGYIVEFEDGNTIEYRNPHSIFKILVDKNDERIPFNDS